MKRSKQRLVFFDFITHYGGAQRSTVRLCARLKALYDIRIVDAYGYCQPYMAELIANDLPPLVLMPRSDRVVIGHGDRPLARLVVLLRQVPHLLVLTRRLITTLCHLNPEMVWTNNTKALFFLAFSSLFHKHRKGLYARGWYRKEEVGWWHRALIRRCTDFVLAISNPTRKAMTAWGVDHRRIMVVPGAVEVRASEATALAPLEAAPARPTDPFTLLVPGSLLHAKGQHTVISAAQLLKQKPTVRQVQVWLAGDRGVGDTSGYLQRLQRQVRDSGLEREVRFLGWRNDMARLMRRADMVVLPTHTEGFPRSIQEAILLKRPIITTPVGGIPDLVTDGVTGHLVPIEDAAALAERIEQIMVAPNETARMVQRAYSRYMALFNGQAQVERFKAAVDRVVEWR